VLVLSSPGILPRIYPEFEGNQLLDGGAKLTVEWISTHKTTDYGVTPLTEEHSTVKQAVDVRTWAIRAAQEEESTSASPATDTADMESRPSAEEKSNLTKSKEGESSEDEGATMTPERPTSSAQTQNGFDNKDASERVLSPSAVGPSASTRSGNLGPTGSSSQLVDPVSREPTKCDNNNNADSRSDVLDDVRYGLSRALNAWIERKVSTLLPSPLGSFAVPPLVSTSCGLSQSINYDPGRIWKHLL
jgi:hypothetical protein